MRHRGRKPLTFPLFSWDVLPIWFPGRRGYKPDLLAQGLKTLTLHLLWQRCGNIRRRRQRRLNRSASAGVRISPHLTPPARRRYGSIALVSSGSGAGSAFGVTPSISRWPLGCTITLVKVICAPMPPSDSDVESVVGSTLPKSEANALEFSMASFAKYLSPPTFSRADRMASRSCSVVLFFAPGGRPAPARGPPCVPFSNWPAVLRLITPLFLIKSPPRLSNRPISSRLNSGGFNGASVSIFRFLNNDLSVSFLGFVSMAIDTSESWQNHHQTIV